MIGRRTWLAALGAMAAGVGAGTLGAVAGCRRDDAGPRRGLGPIGAQLYTVRAELERDFDGTLERVRGIGYDEVEFAGYFGRSPRQVRDALERHGLTAPAAHIGLAEVESDWGRTLAAASAIGHTWLVLPWIDAKRRQTLDDWRRLAALLSRAGEAARAAGLRVAYHNHDYEFVRLGGIVPFDLLLAETEPGLVGFELDVYWMAKAGCDPLAWLARRPARFELLHLKDTAGPPDHAMMDVGAGVTGWSRLLAAAKAAGARHMFVEHDEPGDALASLRSSYGYLRRLETNGLTRS
jgi:sugar phosphate isomerase/epimerase